MAYGVLCLLMPSYAFLCLLMVSYAFLKPPRIQSMTFVVSEL